MSSAVSIDLPTLISNLKNAKEHAQLNIDELRVKWANKILRKQQENVPVRTGKLRQSLMITHSVGRSVIGTDLYYGKYVEYGTGQFNEFGGAPYEIRPKNPNGVLVFEINGRKIFAKKVIHPGIRPQPFIRTSVDEVLDEIGADTASVGVSMITGGK